MGLHAARSVTCALAVLLAASAVQALVVERGPYVQMTTSTSAVIRWRTDGATWSRVDYGTTAGDLSQTVTVNQSTSDHEVQLTGLAPDTRYYYAVGSAGSPGLAGGDADHFFVTHPTPGTARASGVVTLFTGDQGDTCFGTSVCPGADVRDRVLEVAGAQGLRFDAWIMLGDNAYGSGQITESSDLAYQLALFDRFPTVLRQTAAWPCVGNHDLTFNGIQTHRDIFTLPANGEAGGFPSGTEDYYSFDVGNVHFVNLKWEGVSAGCDDCMVSWLIADLAATTQPWKVVSLHGPLHTWGSHNSDATGHHAGDHPLITYREVLTPIFDTWGVDLVMAGHSHNYERSGLVRSDFDGFSWDFDPALHEIDGGPGPYVKDPAGGSIVYVVLGNSAKFQGWSNPSPHPVVNVRRNGRGAGILEATCDELRFQYVDMVDGVTDQFTIRKPWLCTPPACAAGNLPGGFRALRVNGSPGDADGTVTCVAGEPVTISFAGPSSIELDFFKIAGHFGASAPPEAFTVPGFGDMCYAPKQLDPTNVALFALPPGPGPWPLPWSRTYDVPLSAAGTVVELQAWCAAGNTAGVSNRVQIEVVAP